LIDSLLRRDYFRFMLKKYPSYCFVNSTEHYEEDINIIKKWTNGQTDCDLVNDIIIKLNETGYLNEQERIFVATYFIYNLKQHWLCGTTRLEQQLIAC